MNTVSPLDDNPIFNMFGGNHVPTVSVEEINRVKDTYFQAVMLHRQGWCPVESTGGIIYIQIRECDLLKLQPSTHLTIDLLVRENAEVEEHYFNDFLIGAELRENQALFYSSRPIPVHIVLGLKLVSDLTGEIVVPPPEDLRKHSFLDQT